MSDERTRQLQDEMLAELELSAENARLRAEHERLEAALEKAAIALRDHAGDESPHPWRCKIYAGGPCDCRVSQDAAEAEAALAGEGKP